MFKTINEDLIAMTGTAGGLLQALRWILYGQGCPFRYVMWYRIFVAMKRGGAISKVFSPLAYMVLRHYEFKFGIHVDTNISIGARLNIVHGDGVYLNAERIGSDFKVYQSVTLGVDQGVDGRPVIGDRVTVFSGAVVVGPINIGDDVVIGANSIVSKDIPSGVTVVGVNRIVKRSDAD